LATFTFAFDALFYKPAFNIASSGGSFEAGNHGYQVAASQPYADGLGTKDFKLSPVFTR
jgi:hypothetical protein